MREGIVLKGKEFQIDGFSEILELCSEYIVRKVYQKIIADNLANASPPIPEKKARYLTSKEIATITRRSTSTVTRHLALGILKGRKVGKSWLVLEEEFHKYMEVRKF